MAVIFVPSSSWRKIFSGRFGTFAAVFSSTPNPEAYILTNGSTVNAMIADHSGGVYIGGTFTSFGLNVGAGIAVSSSTGIHLPAFAKVSGGNGNVNVAVQDGAGGWYIGGNFTKVGTTTIKYVAHILSDGSLDPVFAPLESDINYEVLTMVLSTSTNRLYLGGQFSQVGGDFDRNYIAALNATNGTLVSAFHPTASDYVRALALSPDENTLYMGGSFTLVGTTTADTSRLHIAAVSTSNGDLVSSFDPGADNEVDAVVLSSGGNMLYVGGNFNNFGGVTRNYLAQYDTVGATTTSFAPDPSAQVFSLAFSPDQSLLYMGGDFTTLAGGGTTRNYIAAVSTTTAIATSFDPSASFIVYSIAPSSDGSTVYFGGDFTSINTNTTPVTRNRLAAVNASDGSVISTFDANLNSVAAGLSLSANGNLLYVAGYFNEAGSTAHNRVAHILSDGTVDPNFDPTINNGSVASLALSPDGNTLYMGGAFTLIDGVTYNHLAAVSTADGVASSTFNPNVSHEVDALAITSDGNTLYIGGQFITVGGVTYDRLAAINTADGTASTTFNPDVNGDVYAITLTPDESKLYFGGFFSQVGGSGTRNNIAAVNTSDGSSISSFDPNTDFPVYALALATSTNVLYFGGQFGQVGGGAYNRNHIAAYNITAATTTTNFDPDLNDDVYTLALSDNILYIGGPFTTINTNTNPTTRNRIAAVDTTNGTTTSFNPNSNNTVFSLVLSSSNDTLFMGGSFTSVGGDSTLRRFVSFPVVISATPPAPRSRRIIVISTPPPPLVATTTSTTTLTVLPRALAYQASSTIASTTLPTVATSTPSMPSGFCFDKNLSAYTSDPDVKYLQVFLNDQGLNVTAKGSETDYYGLKTFNGVVSFQRMLPGALPGTGNFGNYTRKKANNVLGCPTTFEISTTTPEIPATSTPIIPVIEAPTTTPSVEIPTTKNPTPLIPISMNPNGLFSSLVDSVRQSYGQTMTLLRGILPAMNEIINSPTGSLVTKIISTVGLVLGLTISLGAIAFATPGTFSEILLIPGRLAGLVLGALGIKRKIRRWGTVYDSVTKRPLDPVYVTLIDATTNKEIASAITDLDGRYGFLVVPGKYKIMARKTNYIFPSQKMNNVSFDEVYNDLYYGGEVLVTAVGDTITKNIPMDSQSFDWNEFAKNKSNINTFIKKKDVTWARISNMIFAVGGVISLIALFFAPRPYNLIIAILYVIAYIFNHLVLRVKKPGTIKERSTGLPLSFAIVKIFREGMPADMPIVKKITDKYGKYYALVPKGNYSIQIDKKNDDGSYSQVFKSNMATMEKGIINEDLVV